MNVKPRIFVSKCIEICACRYDGQKINNNFALKLFKYADIVSECPETAIGLGVPRKPIRIIAFGPGLQNQHLIQPETGVDYTDIMNKWSDAYLKNLGPIDGFLMKSKSPSSGVRDVKIYSKSENSAVISKKGSGFFGGKISRYYPGVPVEDEARLLNYDIRDHFLKAVFTFAGLRKVTASGKPSEFIKFHEENKILFMSYNQFLTRKMGKIVASSGKGGFKNAAEEYRKCITILFSSMPSKGNTINAYEHVFGYFKKGLSSEEKKYFLDMMQKYRNKKIKQDIIQCLLKSYAIRFGTKYILTQSFFSPYPEELSGGD